MCFVDELKHSVAAIPSSDRDKHWDLDIPISMNILSDLYEKLTIIFDSLNLNTFYLKYVEYQKDGEKEYRVKLAQKQTE